MRSQRGESVVTVVPVHMFGMGVARANIEGSRLASIVKHAQADPPRKVAIFLGDWNVDAPGEAPISASGERGQSRAGPAALRAVLGKMVEAHQPRPTRADPGAGTLTSRIDRIYISTPGWLLLRMDVRAWADKDPLWLHARGISDHAPVFVRVAPKGRVPSASMRIPQWIVATGEHERWLIALERAAGLADLSP